MNSIDDVTNTIPGGLFIIAVSGGVDSMVLLYSLQGRPNIKLVVAHYDHGIRSDSEQDRKLVQEAAKRYNLPFVYDRGYLGIGSSEDEARIARYVFLNKVMQVSGASGIIMAHHQDDLLETAIANLMRGTGRKGLSSLQSTDIIKRPLLTIEKDQIYKYARAHNLAWREDSTNQDLSYKRNYIRHKILPKFSPAQRLYFNEILMNLSQLNQDLDEEIGYFLKGHSKNGKIDRPAFILLPHKVALEVMASWLRQNNIREFSSKLLDKLVISAKVLEPGKNVDINLQYYLQINRDNLALVCREC